MKTCITINQIGCEFRITLNGSDKPKKKKLKQQQCNNFTPKTIPLNELQQNLNGSQNGSDKIPTNLRICQTRFSTRIHVPIQYKRTSHQRPRKPAIVYVVRHSQILRCLRTRKVQHRHSLTPVSTCVCIYTCVRRWRFYRVSIQRH